jgi:hypothetical protein
MKTVSPSPAAALLTSAWYPAMIPLASSAFTRRRHADGDSATASARSTFAIRPSRCSLATMARSTRSGLCSGMKPTLQRKQHNDIALLTLVGAIFAIACEPISATLEA